MRPVDLIPPEVTARRETHCRLRAWARRLGLSAVAAATVFAGLYGLTEGRHSELLELTRKYSSLHQRLNRAGNLLEERERLARNQKAIALIRNDRTAVWLMGIVEEALPPECCLRSFRSERCSFRDPDETAGKEQEQCSARLTICGLAPSHQEVGHIIRKLIVSRAFSDVALVSTNDAAGTDGGHDVEFEILCMLSGEGGSSNARGYGNLEAEPINE